MNMSVRESRKYVYKNILLKMIGLILYSLLTFELFLAHTPFLPYAIEK